MVSDRFIKLGHFWIFLPFESVKLDWIIFYIDIEIAPTGQVANRQKRIQIIGIKFIHFYHKPNGNYPAFNFHLQIRKVLIGVTWQNFDDWEGVGLAESNYRICRHPHTWLPGKKVKKFIFPFAKNILKISLWKNKNSYAKKISCFSTDFWITDPKLAHARIFHIIIVAIAFENAEMVLKNLEVKKRLGAEIIWIFWKNLTNYSPRNAVSFKTGNQNNAQVDWADQIRIDNKGTQKTELKILTYPKWFGTRKFISECNHVSWCWKNKIAKQTTQQWGCGWLRPIIFDDTCNNKNNGFLTTGQNHG